MDGSVEAPHENQDLGVSCIEFTELGARKRSPGVGALQATRAPANVWPALVKGRLTRRGNVHSTKVAQNECIGRKHR